MSCFLNLVPLEPWWGPWPMMPSLEVLFCESSFSLLLLCPCWLGRRWTKRPWFPAIGKGWVTDQEVPVVFSFPWQVIELKGHMELRRGSYPGPRTARVTVTIPWHSQKPFIMRKRRLREANDLPRVELQSVVLGL